MKIFSNIHNIQTIQHTMNSKLNNWIKTYSNQLNFNGELKNGNYEKIIELMNCGFTWEGIKSRSKLGTFILPDDPEQFSAMIKIILDLGFTDNEEPVSFYFICDHLVGKNIKELVSNSQLNPQFYDIYDQLPNAEKWTANDIRVCKVEGEYILGVCAYNEDFQATNLHKINVGGDRLFEFISTLSKFEYDLMGTEIFDD